MSLTEINSASEPTENGDQALIAIIEEGVDILHEAFRNASGNTRIISLWDQTDTVMLGEKDLENTKNGLIDIPSSPLSFGREYNEGQINKYIEKSDDIPITLSRNPSGIIHAIEVAKVISDIAPESKLIIVITAIEGHPYFVSAHELALKHIKYISQPKDKEQKKPVVINISQGLHIGGHDGNSLIEKALDRFSNHAKDQGVVIVTAAGNSRDKKSHAKLIASIESSSFLCWQAMNVYKKNHKVELWFNSQNLMKFRLINPSQNKSRWFFQDEIEEHKFPTSDVCKLRYKVKDGSLAVTIAAPDKQPIETGEWKLEIVGISLKHPEEYIHAWIQHIDGRISTRAIEFSTPEQIDEKITLTTFGTAKTVITVGSVDPSKLPLSATKFSSLGPTRDGRKQPILVASGDKGTSFAAPRVTGAIALLLSARKKQCELDPALSQFNAADIKQIMSEMTQNPNENWSYETGYGALDIGKLIDNLDILAKRVMTSPSD